MSDESSVRWGAFADVAEVTAGEMMGAAAAEGWGVGGTAASAAVCSCSPLSCTRRSSATLEERALLPAPPGVATSASLPRRLPAAAAAAAAASAAFLAFAAAALAALAAAVLSALFGSCGVGMGLAEAICVTDIPE